MKFPRVYPLTIPSNHRMIRMIAIVSSMGPLLQRISRGASFPLLSNRCATRIRTPRIPTLVLAYAIVAAVFATAEVVAAQTSASTTASSNEKHVAALPTFWAGAATALAAHETGHLLFDGIFGANPELRKVSFHGFPFFAISH